MTLPPCKKALKDGVTIQFVGECEVFDFICELGATIEVQEGIDIAKDKAVKIF